MLPSSLFFKGKTSLMLSGVKLFRGCTFKFYVAFLTYKVRFVSKQNKKKAQKGKKTHHQKSYTDFRQILNTSRLTLKLQRLTTPKGNEIQVATSHYKPARPS